MAGSRTGTRARLIACARRYAFLAGASVAASCTGSRPFSSTPFATGTPVGPDHGSVVVVGGGAIGPEIYAKFIELAGGPDALIIDVPTAGGEERYPPDWRGARGLRAAGAKNVVVLHTTDRKVADSENFVEPVTHAGAVWFEGGRQWHLVDAYLGTRSEAAFQGVLARGGVVGGTSAGASILASYLVRGAREGNSIMMAPGYERGFGYLHNIAIDQHVVARDRLADLPQVLAKHPELLGISEDEGTAWVVRGSQAEIVGRNKAFVYGGRDSTDAGQPYLTLRPGDRYDLRRRLVTHRAAADSPLSEAFIDSLFADFAIPGAPGAAVLVAQEGRVLVNRGYGLARLGDEAHASTVTTRTNFRLASVTKQFTAAATLLLVRDGALRLDETLVDIFPEFPSYGRRITVRQLLTHTSGLIDYESLVPDTQTTQLKDADVLALIKTRTDSTVFPPGSRFSYSNTGYALLAEVVAKRSRRPFASFLQTRIFTPLGMHKTVAYEKGGPAVAFRAYGHARKNGRWVEADQSSTSAVLGDGGIYSSVDELYRWDQALYTGELLPQEMWNEAFSVATLTDGSKTEYGFGWHVDRYRALPRLSHTGTTIGGRTAILRFPGHHATVIVLTNRDDANPMAMAEQIVDRLLFTRGDARWKAQAVRSTSGCRSVSAVSEMVAWAGCSGGRVLRTVNGGAEWSVDSVAGASALDFRGIAAFDANSAVVTSAGPAEQGQARIYRTADRGRSWTLAWSDTTRGVFLDGVAFWDARHGFTFSDPVDGRFVILTTDDGGAHWARVSPENIPPVLPGEAAFAASNTQLTVLGASHAWIATGGGAAVRVFRSTDRGRSWRVAPVGMAGGPSSGLFGIAFSDERHGLAVGGDYRIERGITDYAVRTDDGGVTWRPAGVRRPDGTTQGLVAVRGSRPSLFVAAGAHGTSFSHDFGASWIPGDTLTSWGIGFASPGVGYVSGPRGRVAKFSGTVP